MKIASRSAGDSDVCNSRCWVPSPQSTRYQAPPVSSCRARAVTLRWRVGVPEEVPRKSRSMGVLWRIRRGDESSQKAAPRANLEAPTQARGQGVALAARTAHALVADIQPDTGGEGVLGLQVEQHAIARQPR